MSMTFGGPLVRGCGTRKKGGLYASSIREEYGHPIEEFLIDSPRAINLDALGLAKVGIKVISVGFGSHVLDWVGENNYPDLAEFIEEARLHGFSRRLPSTIDLAALTPQSRLYLVHAKAVVLNGNDILQAVDELGLQRCPREVGELHCGRVQSGPHDVCDRVWWRMAQSGDIQPVCLPGLFAVVPFNLEVIRDPEGGSHEKIMARAGETSLVMNLVEE